MFFFKKRTKILNISPNATIIEDETLIAWNKKKYISLRDYINQIKLAQEKITSFSLVFLNLENANALNWILILEIQRHLSRLKKACKKHKIPMISYIKTASLKEYLLAAVSDQIAMNPLGEIHFLDFQFEQYFYKKALDKLGIKAQFIRTGPYKTFADKWLKEDISKSHSKMLHRILLDFKQFYQKKINSLRPSIKKIEQLHKIGFINPKIAKKIQLIDCIYYKENLDDFFKKKFNFLEIKHIPLLNLKKPLFKKCRDLLRKKSEIAILYANGVIVDSKQFNPLLMNKNLIEEEIFIKNLEKIKNNKNIKGLLIRVNSPGGSALVSDLIWNLVQKIKQEKPVVISMSNFAASGGYYIAMGAHYIFSEPMTLTGSIGVIMGKFYLKSLFKKLGIHRHVIAKYKNADPMAPDKKFSKHHLKILKNLTYNYYYKIFLKKASLGRNMALEDMKKRAKGRVWSGLRAKKINLVNKIGGIDESLTKLKELCSIKLNAKIRYSIYPKKKFKLPDLIFKFLKNQAIQPLENYNALENEWVNDFFRLLDEINRIAFNKKRCLEFLDKIPNIKN